MAPTAQLVERLRTRVRVDGVKDPAAVRALLREELLALVDPTLDRSLHRRSADGPAVVLVVGVNGTGKTTTTGKLAGVLVAEGQTVRARSGRHVPRRGRRSSCRPGAIGSAPTSCAGAEGADPASVAFDAVRTGVERRRRRRHHRHRRPPAHQGRPDGRARQGQAGRREAGVRSTEVLLVLDATTGQNGLVQARVFTEVVDVTGIVLTKLDGTAKGGIVVAVQRELGVPVKLVGLGEGPDDLAPFDPEAFVDAHARRLSALTRSPVHTTFTYGPIRHLVETRRRRSGNATPTVSPPSGNRPLEGRHDIDAS